eukprot:TRINITY_DN4900_c0_g1_i1.p1 TRINITY_DN4900_c0_g1~~TRINITY_DN4900_c0_g1_i1.p1  ORF type:complete len:568 (+),score=48.44 TRINITY_DN4900_c0_g1_i1:1024-2727(+)
MNSISPLRTSHFFSLAEFCHSDSGQRWFAETPVVETAPSLSHSSSSNNSNSAAAMGALAFETAADWSQPASCPSNPFPFPTAAASCLHDETNTKWSIQGREAMEFEDRVEQGILGPQLLDVVSAKRDRSLAFFSDEETGGSVLNTLRQSTELSYASEYFGIKTSTMPYVGELRGRPVVNEHSRRYNVKPLLSTCSLPAQPPCQVAPSECSALRLHPTRADSGSAFQQTLPTRHSAPAHFLQAPSSCVHLQTNLEGHRTSTRRKPDRPFRTKFQQSELLLNASFPVASALPFGHHDREVERGNSAIPNVQPSEFSPPESRCAPQNLSSSLFSTARLLATVSLPAPPIRFSSEGTPISLSRYLSLPQQSPSHKRSLLQTTLERPRKLVSLNAHSEPFRSPRSVEKPHGDGHLSSYKSANSVTKSSVSATFRPHSPSAIAHRDVPEAMEPQERGRRFHGHSENFSPDTQQPQLDPIATAAEVQGIESRSVLYYQSNAFALSEKEAAHAPMERAEGGNENMADDSTAAWASLEDSDDFRLLVPSAVDLTNEVVGTYQAEDGQDGLDLSLHL